jgi:hypothetical protein
MARKKKEVLEEVQEVAQAQEVMAPLPGEEVKEEVKEVKVEAKEVKEVEAPKAKKWFGACRISGGLRVDILVDGEMKHINFHSANDSKLGADGTRTFFFNPDKFGIIELTEAEAKACIEALKPMNCYKRGFVLVSSDMGEILEAEKKNLANFPQQGTEQELALKGAVVEKFDAEN